MTPKMHHLQDYEVKTIHRSQISEADYNPRDITEQHYKDLKKSMKKIKLREPLVWNEKSGNLVGGHQRLRVLDEEWQRKHKNLDYTLTVVAVALDKKQEIELNIALNNPRLMGDYSIEKMNMILSGDDFPEIDFDIAGIKDEDLQVFGIELDLGQMETSDVDQVMKQYEDIKEQKAAEVPPEEHAKKTDEIKKIKQDVKKNEVDTYVTLTFSNQETKRSFMRRIGEPEEHLFIKGEVFIKRVLDDQKD